MTKKTLCLINPAYLSLRDEQLVIKLPEVEKAAAGSLCKCKDTNLLANHN